MKQVEANRKNIKRKYKEIRKIGNKKGKKKKS